MKQIYSDMRVFSHIRINLLQFQSPFLSLFTSVTMFFCFLGFLFFVFCFFLFFFCRGVRAPERPSICPLSTEKMIALHCHWSSAERSSFNRSEGIFFSPFFSLLPMMVFLRPLAPTHFSKKKQTRKNSPGNCASLRECD